jgi:hypothetical protein
VNSSSELFNERVQGSEGTAVEKKKCVDMLNNLISWKIMNLRRKPKEAKNVKILVFDAIEIQNKVKYLQLKSIISFLDRKVIEKVPIRIAERKLIEKLPIRIVY